MTDRIFNKNEEKEKAQITRKRRLSWTLSDEYYSIPQYQYRGKLGPQSDMGVQVTDKTFITSRNTNDQVRANGSCHSNKIVKSSVSKLIGTSDIIDHLRVSSLSKTELMSATSLQVPNDASKSFIFNKETSVKCRKLMNSSFTIDTEINFADKESKKYVVFGYY